MTKDVIIKISGTQFVNGIEPEQVEVISKGAYYLKNGKHYILYDEYVEGYDEPTKNTIKIGSGVVDIQKHGITSTHMIFEKNKKNFSSYMTPFGNLMIGVEAQSIQVKEQDDLMEIEVSYDMEFNYEYVASHSIHIEVTPKAGKPKVLTTFA